MSSGIRFQRLLRKILDFLNGHNWIRLSDEDVPSWVKKAEQRFYKRCAPRPYWVTKHFVGKNNVYKVYYESYSQGQCIPQFWVKKRRK